VPRIIQRSPLSDVTRAELLKLINQHGSAEAAAKRLDIAPTTFLRALAGLPQTPAIQTHLVVRLAQLYDVSVNVGGLPA
jgi:molybdenum-dependent DNA-binding transcriptional regulator ModE